MFGFQSFAGFERILKSGGKIILIEPGPKHLTELREIIYSEVKKAEPRKPGHIDALGLMLEDTQTLPFKTGLVKQESIKDLLIMTPRFLSC